MMIETVVSDFELCRSGATTPPKPQRIKMLQKLGSGRPKKAGVKVPLREGK